MKVKVNLMIYVVTQHFKQNIHKIFFEKMEKWQLVKF